MGFQVLEINRLDCTGAVVRKIRCLCGHITVFRANDPTLIEAYRRALCGLPTDPERFTLQLDGSATQSQDFFMLGFGERFNAAEQKTVAEYLADCGMTTTAIEEQLLEFGANELLGVGVGVLSEPEARAVRLIGAMANDEKIVLLNDPFRGLSPEIAQRASRKFVDFAWNKKTIVVVTKLTDRPVEWIENEVVQRVQLERPRSKTIGFGGENQMSDLVGAVRSGANEEPTENSAATGAETFTPLMPRSEAIIVPIDPAPAQRERILLYGGAGLAILFLTLVAWFFDSRSPTQLGKSNQEIQNAEAEGTPTGPEAVSQQEAAPLTTQVLERYPAEVRDAVSKAFNDPEAALRAETGFRTEAPPREYVEPRTIVVPPPPPSYNSPQYSQGDAPPSYSADDEEAMNRRRDEIRRRFLEAIQRQQG